MAIFIWQLLVTKEIKSPLGSEKVPVLVKQLEAMLMGKCNGVWEFCFLIFYLFPDLR